MKRGIIVVCLALLCFGCGPAGDSGDGAGSGGAGKPVVGAALLTQTHVFYQDLVKAMEETAEREGLTLRVQYAEFDSSKQNSQVETFIVQGVDAIIVSPNDTSGIIPVVQDARAAGIPVFTADIRAEGADIVSHIASDNVEGGRILGEYLAQRMGGKGTVAIIDHPVAASVRERVSGFEQALANYPEMSIVQRVPGEGQRDKAFKAAQDLLQAHPNINAIFGINDDSALGALAAVEAAGLQDSIIIVGYDGTPEAREKILQGSALIADTVQHPDEIGVKTIETVAAYLRGEEVPEVIPVHVDIIDQESLKKESGT